MDIVRANGEPLPYHRLHEHVRGGLERYFEKAIPPGHFLTAVLENDLREAVGRADDISIEILPDIIRWLYNYAPARSWGRPATVSVWLAERREEIG